MRESFEESGGTPVTYGSPRVWKEVVDAGWRVSKKAVAAGRTLVSSRERCTSRGLGVSGAERSSLYGNELPYVRLGGGVSTVRAVLDADLVDTVHLAVAPVELGRGGKLWDSPDELADRFHLERIASPSGVTHHLFCR